MQDACRGVVFSYFLFISLFFLIDNLKGALMKCGNRDKVIRKLLLAPNAPPAPEQPNPPPHHALSSCWDLALDARIVCTSILQTPEIISYHIEVSPPNDEEEGNLICFRYKRTNEEKS